MQSSSNILRTPPHVLNLRFAIILVAQYQAKKERLTLGRKEGLDIAAEEDFLKARAWQYQQAQEAIKNAPDETLAQAIAGMKMGRAVSRRLRAAGLSGRVARASRLIS